MDVIPPGLPGDTPGLRERRPWAVLDLVPGLVKGPGGAEADVGAEESRPGDSSVVNPAPSSWPEQGSTFLPLGFPGCWHVTQAAPVPLTLMWEGLIRALLCLPAP